MPTILRSGPYRVYFYSHEPNEPPHVHVDRDDLSAKFWLDPIGLARDLGFSARELRKIQRILADHKEQLLEAWNERFGNQAG
jgi:hypothetical protein